MQMLCTIKYVLTCEKLDLQAVTIHEVKQSSLKEQLLRMVHKATQRPSEHGLPPHRPFAADRWLRISCGR